MVLTFFYREEKSMWLYFAVLMTVPVAGLIVYLFELISDAFVQIRSMRRLKRR